MSQQDVSGIASPTVTNTEFGCEIRERNIEHALEQAIALMREGEGPVKSTSRSTIRLLGSVGEPINPEDGARGKQRSVPNTFLTLPVLFVIISNHSASTYSGDWNWLVLIGMTVAGALIRVYFVARHKGDASLLPAVGGVAALAATAVIANGLPTFREAPTDQQQAPSIAEVQAVVSARCTGCPAAVPTWPRFASAPAGIVLEHRDDIEKYADSIYEQTVVLKAMPIGNLTEITDEERAVVEAWYRSR